MTFRSSEKYHGRGLYIDIEMTCWSTTPPLGMKPEIIEIGVVEMNLHTLKITRESSYFVRPKRWEISQHCTELTGITKDDIQKARSFPEVLQLLKEEFTPGKALCGAWGNDANLIEATCHAYGIKTPLRYRLDLSQLFPWLVLLKQTPSLRDAIAMLGLEFDGVPHGALVDARNTARIHAALIHRMRREPDPVAASVKPAIEASPITPFGEKLRRAIAPESFDTSDDS